MDKRKHDQVNRSSGAKQQPPPVPIWRLVVDPSLQRGQQRRIAYYDPKAQPKDPRPAPRSDGLSLIGPDLPIPSYRHDQRSKPVSATCLVFVGRIAPSVTEQYLSQLCVNFGHIEPITMLESSSERAASIRFDSPKAALKFATQFDGSTLMDRCVSVDCDPEGRLANQFRSGTISWPSDRFDTSSSTSKLDSAGNGTSQPSPVSDTVPGDEPDAKRVKQDRHEHPPPAEHRPQPQQVRPNLPDDMNGGHVHDTAAGPMAIMKQWMQERKHKQQHTQASPAASLMSTGSTNVIPGSHSDDSPYHGRERSGHHHSHQHQHQHQHQHHRDTPPYRDDDRGYSYDDRFPPDGRHPLGRRRTSSDRSYHYDDDGYGYDDRAEQAHPFRRGSLPHAEGHDSSRRRRDSYRSSQYGYNERVHPSHYDAERPSLPPSDSRSNNGGLPSHPRHAKERSFRSHRSSHNNSPRLDSPHSAHGGDDPWALYPTRPTGSDSAWPDPPTQGRFDGDALPRRPRSPPRFLKGRHTDDKSTLTTHPKSGIYTSTGSSDFPRQPSPHPPHSSQSRDQISQVVRSIRAQVSEAIMTRLQRSVVHPAIRSAAEEFTAQAQADAKTPADATGNSALSNLSKPKPLLKSSASYMLSSEDVRSLSVQRAKTVVATVPTISRRKVPALDTLVRVRRLPGNVSSSSESDASDGDVDIDEDDDDASDVESETNTAPSRARSARHVTSSSDQSDGEEAYDAQEPSQIVRPAATKSRQSSSRVGSTDGDDGARRRTVSPFSDVAAHVRPKVELEAEVATPEHEIDVTADTVADAARPKVGGVSQESKNALAAAEDLPLPNQPQPQPFTAAQQQQVRALLACTDAEELGLILEALRTLPSVPETTKLWLPQLLHAAHGHMGFESVSAARLQALASMDANELSNQPDQVQPQRDQLPLAAHTSGCARAEGYYFVSAEERRRRIAAGREDQPKAPGPPANGMKDGSDAQTRKKALMRQASRGQRREARAYASNLAVSAQELNLEGSELFAHNLLESRRKTLRFGRSRIHEWGLFAMEDIPANEMVIEYTGEVIRQCVAEERERRYASLGIGSSYLFRIDSDSVVDATRMGAVARFMNHSCQPNCKAKILTVDGQKRICIFSKEPIARGEEITYDYQFPEEEVKIPCFCGAEKCRGYLN